MPTKREAAAEMLARREARRSMLAFVRYTYPQYEAAAHHVAICERLEAVERGEIRRLMIMLPPRHGKSELASRRFPSWYLGRDPGRQVIAASYNSDLANDFGREVRNIVADPDYGKLFDAKLAADSQASNRWHTSAGGMYVAAGVGTAITGRGANLLLIDDPFKDRKEADSELRRADVWAWYTSTAYTRLMPGGAIVVISTRWHDDDLCGKLLAQQSEGGDKWEVLSLQAIDQGKALWPERYPIDTLEQIRSVLPAREWNSLYQQEPIPDEGEYFKADWFGEYEELPEHLNYYGASDYAVTDGGGDYTEHGIFGVDFNRNIYVTDWWRGQTGPDVWIERKCDLVLKYKPLCWFGESGVIRKSVEPFLMARMTQRGAFCRIEWLPSIVDKPSRARPIQGMASMGKVYMPKNAPWKPELLSQLMRFPAGRYDDAVDVMSLMGRGLEYIAAPKLARKKTADKIPVTQHGWMAA